MRTLLLCLLLSACHPVPAADIPLAAQHHKRELTRIARQEFGLAAPVARFAAQIHQESAWRSNAKSRFADGLAQFTPSTAAWIVEIYPDLGEAAPYSPGWALRAMVRYNRWLAARVPGDGDCCSRWWHTLRAYNGGLGYLKREARTAGSTDPAAMAAVCTTHRAEWACAENTDYPRRILLRHEPKYLAAGWPGEAICQASSLI